MQAPLLLFCKAHRKRAIDALDNVVDPLEDFTKESVLLLKCCHKPRSQRIHEGSLGFVVMGFVGFFLNLTFIPINNIIVGSS